MIVGAVLAVLGPVAGLLITVFSMNRAFDATSGTGIAPENKAKHLAEGISESMNATAFGIGLAIVGIVILAISAFFFVRAGNKQSATGADARA
jgi:biopolymer transport protein ExbB/TolQ